MFKDYFEYRKINRQRFNEPFPHLAHNFSFYGKTGKRYIVIAEQYEHEVFAVKFYLQENKSNSKKFQQITKLFECSRVLSTVGRIITKEIIHDNPFSSLVFIGSNSDGESKIDTKRFRLYARIIENKVAILTFEHHRSSNLSSYVLLNINNKEPYLLNKIEEKIKEVLSLPVTH